MTNSVYESKKMSERIANISRGVAVIKVCMNFYLLFFEIQRRDCAIKIYGVAVIFWNSRRDCLSIAKIYGGVEFIFWNSRRDCAIKQSI